jgi:hypothetical protein
MGPNNSRNKPDHAGPRASFLPIVKLERMRRGGNPAGPPVSGSHRILIASGGGCAASAPDLIEPRVVLAAVKTASRRLRRWPSVSLDRRCARRVSNPRPDRETALKPIRETGERFRGNTPPLCGWVTILRIKRRLSLQQDTSQTKEPIRYTTQRTSVRVTALT